MPTDRALRPSCSRLYYPLTCSVGDPVCASASLKKGPQMAGDTRGSDTVHTRYARKGTPTAMHVGQRMPSLELSHQGRRGQPGQVT